MGNDRNRKHTTTTVHTATLNRKVNSANEEEKKISTKNRKKKKQYLNTNRYHKGYDQTDVVLARELEKIQKLMRRSKKKDRKRDTNELHGCQQIPI